MLSIETIQRTFDFSPSPTLILYPNAPVYSIVFINNAFEQLDNYKYSTVIGQGIFDIVDSNSTLNNSNLEDMLLNDSKNKYTDRHLYPIKNKNGEISYIVYSPENASHPLKSNDKSELHLIKNQYQHLFNAIPIPCLVFDPDSLYFLDVNKAAVAEYGYTHAEFLKMTIKDVRPKQDLEAFEKNIKEHIKPNGFDKRSTRYQKKSGEIISVIVEGNLLIFNGKAARLNIVQDVTEKLKAKYKLQDREKLFKSLIQQGSDLIAVLDSDYKYLYISPTSETILSLKPKHFIGKNIIDFVHRDDQERIKCELAQLSTQTIVKISPYRFSVKGEYRWIHTILTDLRNDPIVSGIVANSRDVTTEISHKIKTKESNERYNILSKATSDTVYDWNIHTKELSWNKGINFIFGFEDSGNVTTEWWYNHVHIDDIERVWTEKQTAIWENKSRLETEYRFRCADGSYKYVLDRSFLVCDENQHPLRLIGALQDITEKVKYTQDIEKQNTLLRDISWMQSHIVRAPVAKLIGLANLLFDEEGVDKELVTYFIETATQLDSVIKGIIKKTEDL